MTPARFAPRALILWAWCALCTAGVAWPLFRPGYLLVRDAVSTPRLPWTDATWGMAEAAPRATPQDAVIAALSAALDGGVVVRWLTLAAVFGAGIAGAALARWALADHGAPGPGRTALVPELAAATVMIWNPFVVERLLQGHWSLLLGYAALPGIVVSARSRRPAIAIALAALAGLTPTGAVLAVGVLACAWPGWRRLWAVPVGLCVSAPWLVTGLLASYPAADSGAAAFAARAEWGLGTLGSVLTLGGIWNAQVVPGSRESPWAVVSLLLLAGTALAAAPVLRAARAEVRWLVAGGAAVALAVAALATGPGVAALDGLIGALPGLGLVRDTHKFLAWSAPALAVLSAAAVRRLAGAADQREHPVGGARAYALAGLVALAPLVALPDAPLAAAPLRPVALSPVWGRVEAQVRAAAPDGDLRRAPAVTTLPVGLFRTHPGPPRRVVLDPASRLLPVPVIQSGDLLVRGTDAAAQPSAAPSVVGAEDTRAQRVTAALLADAPAQALLAEGVGWVLVERWGVAENAALPGLLRGLTPVVAGDGLELYRLPGDPVVPEPPPLWPSWAAHSVWALTLLGAAAAGLALAGRGARPAQAGGPGHASPEADLIL